MNPKTRAFMSSWAVIPGLALLAFARPISAEPESMKVSGDFRARFESDTRTKSDEGGGYIEDETRDRFRYRLRIGMTVQANQYVEVGARLSSGDTRDANSPHVVLGSDNNSDNETPSEDNEGNYGFSRDPVTIDKAYVKGMYAGGFAWFGRNSMPLWQQNEYFWDNDVMPEGVAAGYTVKGLGSLSITLQGGNFVIQEGGWSDSNSAPNVHLETYQAVLAGGGDTAEFTAAYGVVSTDGGAQIRSQNPATTAFATYSIADLQAKIRAIPGVELLVGYDLIRSDADEDETGSVIDLGAAWGAWSATIYLVDIEANAVTGFAQDDWPNYYADFNGYQVKLAYRLMDNLDVDLNRFDGERNSDSKQTETRNQVNFNVKF